MCTSFSGTGLISGKMVSSSVPFIRHIWLSEVYFEVVVDHWGNFALEVHEMKLLSVHVEDVLQCGRLAVDGEAVPHHLSF